jgi:hypothetical protein
MKTKDDMLKVVKQWYSYIADLRAKHKLVIVMHDNASKNISKDIQEFFESE